MANPPKLKPDEIKLLNFSILKGMIENPEGFETEEIIKHDFSVDLNLGFNLEEDLIRSTISLKIQTDSGGKNEEEAKSAFHLAFLYSYPNLKELIVEDENENPILHKHLGNAISSITYSTSRGILITRYQGTPFEMFFLPVIDPNSLL